MKNWRLLLLAALAALSLQACDVQVHSGSTKVQEPQAALPEDTQLHAPATTIAVAPTPEQPAAPAEPVAAAPEPAADPAAALPALAPAMPAEVATQSETATLGAAAAVPEPAAPVTATATATAPVTASIAAPTELQRFFESNAARLAAKR
jgi:hypothetical protein